MIEDASPLLAPSAVALLPAHLFFARRVPLVAAGDVALQVELALENFAPFPVDQLYYGWVAAPVGDEALVYAAYRKQFPADQIAAWVSAEAVFPAFIALLGAQPGTPVIRVWRDVVSITAAAWDGRSPLPSVLLTRAAGATTPAELVAETRLRAGLADAGVEEIAGEATGTRRADGRGFDFVIVTPSGNRPATLDRRDSATADVREKKFLAEQRRLGRRDQWLWRGFLGCVAGLAILLVAEGGLLGAGLAVRRLEAQVRRQAAVAEKIATAQSLSERIEELGSRRLAPFEMLSLLNQSRPRSVAFLRVTTTDSLSIEVEAQTATSGDASVYETKLRAAPELATVEIRDLRSREGVTSFVLAATFKAGSLATGGTP